MKIRKFAATAMFAIGAMAITGGTAYADPAAEPNSPAVQQILRAGVDQQALVKYDIAASGPDKTVTVNLSGGTFALAGDSLNILDGAGKVLTSLPLNMQVDGTDQVISVRPSIENNGTQLVSHPVATPIGHWAPTSPQSRSAGIGMAIGAALGVVGGLIVGVIIAIATGGLGVIAVPFTTMIGALIGVAVGGGTGSAAAPDNRQDGWTWQEDCYTDSYTNSQVCS